MLFNCLQLGRLSSSSSDFCSALFRVSVPTKKKQTKQNKKTKTKKYEKRRRRRKIARKSTFILATEASQDKLQGRNLCMSES